MKTKNEITKKAMKAAWTNWKAGRYTSWSECLKNAWKWAKETFNTVKMVVCSTVEIVKETEKAYMFKSIISGKTFWSPKKSVTISEDNKLFGFELWIAMENRISPIF